MGLEELAGARGIEAAPRQEPARATAAVIVNGCVAVSLVLSTTVMIAEWLGDFADRDPQAKFLKLALIVVTALYGLCALLAVDALRTRRPHGRVLCLILKAPALLGAFLIVSSLLGLRLAALPPEPTSSFVLNLYFVGLLIAQYRINDRIANDGSFWKQGALAQDSMEESP